MDNFESSVTERSQTLLTITTMLKPLWIAAGSLLSQPEMTTRGASVFFFVHLLLFLTRLSMPLTQRWLFLVALWTLGNSLIMIVAPFYFWEKKVISSILFAFSSTKCLWFRFICKHHMSLALFIFSVSGLYILGFVSLLRSTYSWCRFIFVSVFSIMCSWFYFSNDMSLVYSFKF